MVFQQLFRPSAPRLAGQNLYEVAIRQARQPAFYTDLKAPDTVEGRFELYTLHVVLLLHRLRGHSAQTDLVAQALFDTYLQALDHALREMGVGDLSVGKKMRKLGSAFYGRAKSFEEALAQSDAVDLGALVGRTIYDGVNAPSTEALVSYIQRSVAVLAETPLEDVMAAHPNWAPIIP